MVFFIVIMNDIILFVVASFNIRGRLGHDHVIVGLTTTNAISAYLH